MRDNRCDWPISARISGRLSGDLAKRVRGFRVCQAAGIHFFGSLRAAVEPRNETAGRPD